MMQKCVLCDGYYTGHGHNAEPLAVGRCCDKCNGRVIWARIEQMQMKNEGGRKE